MMIGILHNPSDLIIDEINQHESVVHDLISDKAIIENIERAAYLISKAIKNNYNKIYLCGCGGSASDCEHIAAEFINKLQNERRSLPAISLASNLSILTSIGNDVNFESIFSRQVEGLITKGDVLIGITTSGTSQSIINALDIAKLKQAFTILLTSNNGKQINKDKKYSVVIGVPSTSTQRVQEIHILIGHILCRLAENMIFGGE